MENIVNFNSEIQPNSIKSGGFNIGVNGTTTDLSDFYTGICPINGGYTIYINKAENGPSIYTPNNDTELVNITNLLGGSVSSVVESLVWINSQSNMTVVNSNYPSIVTDGLVVNLDAGFVSSYPRNGTSWNDLSGSGNTGNLVNGPTFSSDGGGSIIFDDVDDLCSTSYSLSSERFSLCFWIKVPTALTEFKRLFQVSGNSILVIIEASLAVTFRTQSDTTFFAPGSLVLNQWTYVSCVYDNSFRYLYTNGVLRGKIATSSINQNLSNLSINTAGRPLNCFMSQTSLYNRALSASEILQNYYAGLQKFIPTDGLVLSLDAQNTNLYATSPTTAYDISGNGNNGVLLNGVQQSGRAEGIWVFDGSNDYINIPSNQSLQITGDQTLAFWVYPKRRDRRQNFYNKAYGGEGTITYELNGSLSYYWGTAGTNANPYQGVQSTTALQTLNTWYFVVLVRELSTPTKTIKWYINGVLNNTVTASYTSAVASSFPISIGTGYAGSFLGEVGLVNQYNRALSQTEVSTIYNATKTRYGL